MVTAPAWGSVKKRRAAGGPGAGPRQLPWTWFHLPLESVTQVSGRTLELPETGILGLLHMTSLPTIQQVLPGLSMTAQNPLKRLSSGLSGVTATAIPLGTSSVTLSTLGWPAPYWAVSLEIRRPGPFHFNSGGPLALGTALGGQKGHVFMTQQGCSVCPSGYHSCKSLSPHLLPCVPGWQQQVYWESLGLLPAWPCPSQPASHPLTLSFSTLQGGGQGLKKQVPGLGRSQVGQQVWLQQKRDGAWGRQHQGLAESRKFWAGAPTRC
jgi:hypothetical protein